MGKVFHYGAYRSCPVCGKQFFVSELGGWAYKRYLYKAVKDPGNTNDKAWFCSWSCLREYDRIHGDRKKKPLDWEE